MKVSEMKTHQEVLAGYLRDPAFRQVWERSALARAIAVQLVGYRIEHELSQAQLAQIVGMQQPAIARLEAGENNPTWETLTRLSAALGIEIVVTIKPLRRSRAGSAGAKRSASTERVHTTRGSVAVTLR